MHISSSPYLSPYVIFILVLLVCISWVFPKKIAMSGVMVLSIAFLGYYATDSLLILLTLSVASYLIPRQYSFKTQSILVIILIVSGVLVVYKIATTVHASKYIMPLGLSFYSFRIIHYVFEGYKQKLPKHTFRDYLTYLFFLPTFIVGPIHRFQPFYDDLKKRDIKNLNISYGLERILYGYAKIIIIAAYLIEIKFLDYIQHIKTTNHYLYIYLSPFAYWFNLYFQFSGYSDIAIGFSRLMGFKIMENFNYPFLAKNISEFWQRWHISLSTWIKDYVYIPLVSLTRKPFLSILVSLVIFGLWHEFSFNYIVWGMYHALGIAIWHKFQYIKVKYMAIDRLASTKIFYLFSVLLTLHFVVFSFKIRTLFLQLLHLNY